MRALVAEMLVQRVTVPTQAGPPPIGLPFGPDEPQMVPSMMALRANCLQRFRLIG